MLGVSCWASVIRIFFHWHLTPKNLPFRGVAQPGSALALGARGPRFKSGRPDYVHCSQHIREQKFRKLVADRARFAILCIACGERAIRFRGRGPAASQPDFWRSKRSEQRLQHLDAEMNFVCREMVGRDLPRAKRLRLKRRPYRACQALFGDSPSWLQTHGHVQMRMGDLVIVERLRVIGLCFLAGGLSREKFYE